MTVLVVVDPPPPRLLGRGRVNVVEGQAAIPVPIHRQDPRDDAQGIGDFISARSSNQIIGVVIGPTKSHGLGAGFDVFADLQKEVIDGGVLGVWEPGVVVKASELDFVVARAEEVRALLVENGEEVGLFNRATDA